jgi:hypothetical protein
MERAAIIDLLEIIDQQVSSAILGGREEEYEELERLGLINIKRDRVQHSASLTQKGLDYLSE